jgi:Fic family protein
MKQLINIQSLIDKKDLIKQSMLNQNFVSNIDAWLRMELTYSSNSIEGNTLTRQEVALVVNDNLTVAGKGINEIVEITNHDKAIKYILEISKSLKIQNIDEDIILRIHSILLNNIDQDNAGKYRSVPVRISGSMMIPPNYLKVKELMKTLINSIIKTLESSNQVGNEPTIQIAIDAHYELVSIHPFIDGNGRTARLLFNLILMIDGYPFVYIAKEDRSKYLKSLEKAQTGGSRDEYQELLLFSINRSLDMYLNQDFETQKNTIYKIGELSAATKIPISTIRYWLSEGLISNFNMSKGGYALFNSETINRLEHIQKLKTEKRMSIDEIKKLLN